MSERKTPPINVIVGWIDSPSKKDAVEYAKGYALRHLSAPQICWFTVMSFLNGHLYEVQEGGPGESYLPAIADALARGVEPAWFRVGQRAFSVALRDGRPYCILQPRDESNALFGMKENEIQPSGRMRDVLVKGRPVMTIGGALFATGMLFLVANAGFYAATQLAIPEARRLDQDALPHRQWGKVDHVAPTMYVESLWYAGGQWSTSVKPIQVDATKDPAPVSVRSDKRPFPSSRNAMPPANGTKPSVQPPSPPPAIAKVVPPMPHAPASAVARVPSPAPLVATPNRMVATPPAPVVPPARVMPAAQPQGQRLPVVKAGDKANSSLGGLGITSVVPPQPVEDGQ